MGWFSISKEGEWLREGEAARPVQAGEEGKLQAIGQEDYGHKVVVDLVNGVFIIDYNTIGWQNGTLEITEPRTVLYMCDDTQIVGELVDVKRRPGRATKEGVIKQRIIVPEFRPIWFTRVTMEVPAKIIGAQTTLTKTYGGRNVKKLVTLFADGRLGIH